MKIFGLKLIHQFLLTIKVSNLETLLIDKNMQNVSEHILKFYNKVKPFSKSTINKTLYEIYV